MTCVQVLKALHDLSPHPTVSHLNYCFNPWTTGFAPAMLVSLLFLEQGVHAPIVVRPLPLLFLSLKSFCSAWLPPLPSKSLLQCQLFREAVLDYLFKIYITLYIPLSSLFFSFKLITNNEFILLITLFCISPAII